MPDADAGADQVVTPSTTGNPVTVTLDATSSTDPDAGQTATLTYQWERIDSTPITGGLSLTNPNTAQPTFTAPTGPLANDLTLEFRVTVTDNDNTGGSADFDTVSVTVTNRATVTAVSITSTAPTHRSDHADTYGLGNTVTAAVTFSENVTVTTAGGTPQLALGADNSSTLTAAYASGSGTTTLNFTYTVAATDRALTGITIAANALILNGGTIKDDATLNAALSLGSHALTTAQSAHKVHGRVGANMPNASAGDDQAVAAGTAGVTLSAADANDPPSATLSYAWQQIGANAQTDAVTLSSTTIAQPTFTAPSVSGNASVTLQFRVTITDTSNSLADEDTVTVTVKNPAAVDQLTLTAAPGDGHKRGDTITAAVRFTENVTVTTTGRHAPTRHTGGQQCPPGRLHFRHRNP